MVKGGRAMKKLLLLGVGSALMFTMGGVGPAQADNGPHISTAGAAVTAASRSPPVAGAPVVTGLTRPRLSTC